MIQNLINHIVFVVDSSSSMQGIASDVVKVFDNEIAALAKRSKELDQETRVSIYFFGSDVKCVLYDSDVLRLPSIKNHYKPNGMTKLIDAQMQAISDLEKTPQLYGDHSFLLYTATDGEENDSKKYTTKDLVNKLNSLPDNWTVAAFVPNARSVHAAKQVGFPAQNISIWDANSSAGANEVGNTMRSVTDTYMVNRSKGIRSTKTLFNLNVNNLNTTVVKSVLTELSPTAYCVFPVGRECAIKEFVEGWTKLPYRIGSAYYLITKPEKIQVNKSILVQDKLNGKVYAGSEARNLLGLPNYEVKVNPADHGKYNLYIQSNSVNRKLVPGTPLIVLN